MCNVDVSKMVMGLSRVDDDSTAEKGVDGKGQEKE